MKRLILAAALAAAMSTIEAQDAPNFGESVDVSIINVDFVVRDKDGNPVPGLTAADFVIYDNGKPQPITNFAEYRTDAVETPPQATEAPVVAARPPEKRYLVFFIDRLNLRETTNREHFFRGLRAFAEDSMREGDEAAIFYWKTSLQTTLAMTADRVALRAAIDKIEEESKLRLDFTDIEKGELEAREAAWRGDPSAAQMMETDKRVAAQRAFDLQQRKTYAINSVIRSVAGLEGRKVMILATERYSKLPGLEYGYASTEFNARKMIDSVVDEANAAAVTVYGFFPRGLDRDPMAAGAGSYDVASGVAAAAPGQYSLLMNEAETIDSIATRTGGTATLGGKLSSLALDATSKQLDNYYSIAYRSPDSGKARSRTIKVKVNRPGLEVLARNSVVNKSDEEVTRDRMISGILFGVAPSAIPIQVAQGAVRKKGLTTYAVPVEITIPIGSLTTLPGSKGHDGKFRVLAIAASANGDVGEVAEKTQTFHIPANDLEKARKSTFKYSLEIVVRDTSNRALVAVMDDLGKETGYAEVALDLKKLAKSEPVTNVKPTSQQRVPGPGGMSGSGRFP